jgi:broad specificity phosphatase PhoE
MNARMAATLIYLIRHGETNWNAERRIQGRLDAPLSVRGAEQVRALAEALSGRPISAIYSSPLPRALETARPLAVAHKVPVWQFDQFREIDQGEWESRLLDEVQRNDGDRLRAWRDAPESVRVPGGETLAEVQCRAVRALTALAERHAGTQVAVVAHGGVNKTVLLWILGASLASYWRIRQDNACVNLLEVDGDNRRVLCLNDTSHLERDA